MGYDVMGNGSAAAAAAAPRDIAGAGKKKRAQRSAKLKQCKLEAKREQWLSQVKSKDSKALSVSVSPDSSSNPSLSLPRARRGRIDVEEQEDPGLHYSSDSESPSPSPFSSSSGHASRKGRPASSIGSSCSVGWSSRTVSDEEFEEEEVMDRGGEKAPLDDWEAVADALSVVNDRSRRNPDSPPPAIKTAPDLQREAPGRAPSKPEPIIPPPRAWRPDDTSRPRSLPSLSKQLSFAVAMERQCGSYHPLGMLSTRPPCPICCEDLDITDSSFLPCPCGFHLCLFCYKRILDEDGRCPGCRKQYSSTDGNTMTVGSGNDGRVTFRFSRSCSMGSRS